MPLPPPRAARDVALAGPTLRVITAGVRAPVDLGPGAQVLALTKGQKLPLPGELRHDLGPDGAVVVLVGGDAAVRFAPWLGRDDILPEVDAVLLVHPTVREASWASWLGLAEAATRPGGPLVAWWAAYEAPFPKAGVHPYDAGHDVLHALTEACPHPASPASVDAARFDWPEGELLQGPGDIVWSEPPVVAHQAHGGFVLLCDTSTTACAHGFACLYAPGALVRAVLQPRQRAGHLRRPPPLAALGPQAEAVGALATSGAQVVVTALRGGVELAKEAGRLGREIQSAWASLRR